MESTLDGCFVFGIKMEKSAKNKLKDYKRTKGKKWIDAPAEIKKRISGSGVRFGGKYIDQ